MENSAPSETFSDIPPAGDYAQTETDESSYEFQLEKVLEKIKSLNKKSPTICLFFKATVNDTLVKKIVGQGYTVKIDSYYDSSKEDDNYNSKMRITNPKFNNSNNLFMDKIEDQLKGCAFSQSNFQVPDEAKGFLEGILGGFKL